MVEPSSTFGQISRTEFEYYTQELIRDAIDFSIYKGTCRGSVVTIRKNKTPVRNVESLEKEATLLRDSRHPHIVQLLGLCIDGGDFYVVTEYFHGLTLYSFLHERKDYIPLYKLAALGSQIILGLSWIHSLGIVHRDIRSPFIFMADRKGVPECKIGNLIQFGDLASEVGKRWRAPEVLASCTSSQAADVYSFAVIWWECLTREVPFSALPEETDVVQALLATDLTLAIPDCVTPTFRKLMASCWARDPTERPSSAALSKAFPAHLIETAISDPGGVAFWTAFFGSEFAAPFNVLVRKLFGHVGELVSHTNPISEYLSYAIPRSSPGVTMANEFGSFLKWFGPLTADGAILARVREVFEKDWFWPDLSTEDAEQYLKTQPDGTFLIRFSTTPQKHGSFTLSRVRKGGVAHRRYTWLPESLQFADPAGLLFPSLSVVVEKSDLAAPLKELGKIGRIRRSKQPATYEETTLLNLY